jgi:transposase InsO family protein
MKFAFIAREKATYPIDLLCSVLGVSRAGFYAAQGRPVAARHQQDQQLAVHVAAAHVASRRRYGSPRVHRELQAQGHEVGRHRVARLMREQGLRAREKRRFQRTTDSQHGLPVAANILDRQFTVPTPNTAWVSDITYLWTREGWLYLIVILDLFSRRVVGWALDDRITRQLALDALTMALQHRLVGPGLVCHSDRGSQYASADYQAVLAAHGLVCSMSRRGNCWDNAVAESFFSTLKMELAHEADWATKAGARADVTEYLEIFYNRQRRHSALGYLSPVAFERQHEEKQAA